MCKVKAISFDNFQADVSNVKFPYLVYYGGRKSLPKLFEGARIGTICATVKKDNKTVQLWQRCGLREKNNGKGASRIIENGWELLNEITPSVIQCSSYRVAYLSKKYLHKDIITGKNSVTLKTEENYIYSCSGVEAWEILSGLRALEVVTKQETSENVNEITCPF
jgi:hypothetical protein